MDGFDFVCFAWKRRTGLAPLVGSALSGLSRLAKAATTPAAGKTTTTTTTETTEDNDAALDSSTRSNDSSSGANKTKSSVGSPLSKWEPRTLTIQGRYLCYYENGGEDGPPRGKIDILKDKLKINIVGKGQEDDAPTPHEVDISASITTGNSTKKLFWKFCFDQQEDLIRCLSHIHEVLAGGGVYKPKHVDRFEHDFVAGDHIYRWEMICIPPVIYPIQIHGIVLEAGRNCIVVADFGLTGYSKKEGEEFNHVDDRHNNVLYTAWKKMRPHQDQRLNIVTVIENKEIRQWTKARYDEDSILKFGHGHWFGGLRKRSSSDSWFAKMRKSSSDGDAQVRGRINSADGTTRTRNNTSDSLSISNGSDKYANELMQPPPDYDEITSCPVIGIIDTPGAAAETGTQTPASAAEDANLKKSQTNKQHTPAHELPQSDPVDIVLARANYLLENMDVIPPYHVFYSNSECIAVWCKTGRWSTLQTAVFLSTNSVGAAKSSTLVTIGLAATNPLLAPVVALGGLVWVTTPMVILKKSRGKWEEYTKLMTDLFWAAAPNFAFVAAIENWSGLGSHQQQQQQQEQIEEENANFFGDV